MVELSIRLLLAGALVFIAGITGMPPFAVAIQLGIVQGVLGFLGSRLEKRSLRTPAIAGLMASADAAIIACALAAVPNTPALETYGILALAPILVATARHNANPLLMAPIASAAMIIAEMGFHKWALPNGSILGYALAFLTIGCLVRPIKRTHVTIAGMELDLGTASEPQVAIDQDQLTELRETYLNLRDAYRDLDRKSRKDRVAAMVSEARSGSPSETYFKLTEKIIEASGCETAILYTVTQLGDTFIVRGASGSVNETQLTEALQISTKQAIALIRDRADELSQTFNQSVLSRNLVLQHEGRVVGLLTINAPNQDLLFEALETMEPCAHLIGSILVEEQRREATERRLTETEVLYSVVVNADGATTRADIASRVAKDFQAVLQIEHLAIYAIEADEAAILAQEGREMDILSALTFHEQAGLSGWLKSGAKEVSITDMRSDTAVSSEFVIRNRTGSCVVIPIGQGDKPVGFMTAASSRIAGIDNPEIETLRAAAAELSRMLQRPDMPATVSDGLLTPRQFVERVGKTEGVMVSLIPMQIKELEARFGKPAISHALRTMVLRIRPHVPAGAFLCRHPDGMFLVYLPGVERSVALTWANDIAERSPSTGIRTPDGTTRIPMQLRVKVAALTPAVSPQINQLLAA